MPSCHLDPIPPDPRLLTSYLPSPLPPPRPQACRLSLLPQLPAYPHTQPPAVPTAPSHPPLQPDHAPHAIRSPVPSPQPCFANFLFQLDQACHTHPHLCPLPRASSLLRAPPTAGKGSSSCAPRDRCPGHHARAGEEVKVQAAYLKHPALQEGGKHLFQKEGNELRTSSVQKGASWRAGAASGSEGLGLLSLHSTR